MDKDNTIQLEDAMSPYATPFVVNRDLERRILWKVDMRLIPPPIYYVYSELIGNAKEAGMGKDLDLSSSDYSLAVSIFFIGYLLLEVPSNMILSRTRPSLYLPILMIIWGGMVICYVGVNSKKGLIGLRFCLGLIEAGFFPGVLLFMSNWYRKSELARRFSIFYCASLISGAVGGLIAGGDIERHATSSAISSVEMVVLEFVLPDFPATTKWLTPEEREYAVRRLEEEDNSSRTGNISHWQSFLSAIHDWRTWLFLAAQTFCTCAGTITYFIPTLMASLNYTGQDVQYMTIPIYMVAFVIVLLCGFSSDYFNERPKHIMALATMSTISLIIVATIHNPKTRYAFLAFGVSGIWGCSPLVLSYLSNTISRPAEKRAVAIAFVNAFANLSSVYGSYIWPSSTAPAYVPGFTVTIVLMFASIVTAFLLMVLTKDHPHENAEDRGTEIESETAR
ncbi:major facilitator superfamily domain-containing protein [Penicillium waksmanii]|uniref:major facilitator superfamily domain-containing protein n=1 Tax=Penicillium waksmanii TaxID=69791 RepID=UPI002547CB16|nr:major facilitator superfamily domain-containing protein [Penicillium waksmanii]KAJ5963058.1 major facilitator superfamily domain-containing protein [Penicillium waksmanii]